MMHYRVYTTSKAPSRPYCSTLRLEVARDALRGLVDLGAADAWLHGAERSQPTSVVERLLADRARRQGGFVQIAFLLGVLVGFALGVATMAATAHPPMAEILDGMAWGNNPYWLEWICRATGDTGCWT